MKNIIQLYLLALVCCLITSCNSQKSEPTFAVCCKLSQYPVVRQAGYDYIEPGVGDFLAPGKEESTFLTNLAKLEEMNGKIISCTVFLPGHLKVTGPETKHDEILTWAETTFSRAQKVGIPYIVFGSGGARRIPEGFTREEATEQFISLCKKLGPLAEEYKVTIVVEPLNTKETNMINSLKEGAEIVESVDHPNIRLLCDIYHMLQESESPDEIILFGKYIKHCHIAEKGTRAAPGTDSFDFTPYFKALKQIKYNGCISIEGNWDDFDSRAPSALQYMKEQYQGS